MVPKTLRRTMDAILVAAFVVGLLAPTIDLVSRPASARSALRENRNPWPYPAKITGLTTLSKFPAGFENWFEDRFGLRDRLLRANQALRLFVFHSEASPTLIEGDDGWLFFGADGSVPVLRGLEPFDVPRLERWQKDLEARRDWLRLRGIEYVFAIAPNKESIYGERLPGALAKLGPTRLDQLAAWMRARSDVRFVDLRAAMLAEKQHDAGGDFAYYPLGSHWSWRGAWAAWNAIVASIEKDMPALRPILREACVLRETLETATDSMAQHTYIQDLLNQAAFELVPVSPRATLVRNERHEVSSSTQADPSLPAVVVLHDSFGVWILPFVAESASRMTAVWQHGFPKEAIPETQPDLVVQVYTERMLVWGLPELTSDADVVDAPTFAGFEPLWTPHDIVTGELPAASGGLRAARTDGGIAIEVTQGDGVLNLPAVEITSGAELAVHVDVTAPAPAMLTIFYQLADDRRFTRSRAAIVGLAAGRNDLRFRIRAKDVGGALKLRIGPNGAYVLHALEARVAR